jgi:peroxiredoxin Q/BCP
MLKAGDPAPEFELPDADMTMVRSADLSGRSYVIYFYPKDDTPGCTLEAQEFTDLMNDFQASDTLLIGVSRDNCASHGRFRDKYGLDVTLLADVDGHLCEAYGVWQEKEKNGEKRLGIVRSTFIVDGGGVIRYAEYGVTPKGHAEKILEVVRSL